MKVVSIFIITIFICTHTFAQDTSNNTSQRFQIIKKPNAYFINGQKIKSVKPYMMSLPESAYLYHLANKNSVGGFICLGIALTSELISFTPKGNNKRPVIVYTVSIPALVGAVYFGAKANGYRRKALNAYNKKAIM